jgi:hypothetical protein
MPPENKTVDYHEFQSLSQDMGEMKTLMGRMVDAINRITLLDERQQVVANFMEKLDDRMSRMETRQHEAELASVIIRGATSRTEALEVSYREMHIDRERDKARFQTVVWMIRGLWGIVGAIGIGGIVAVARMFPGVGA